MAPCLSPLKLAKLRSRDGSFTHALRARHGEDHHGDIDTRCGGCLPCRVHKAQSWRARICCEALCHSQSISVCLTYADDKLPPGGSLDPAEVVLFLKRLRKAIAKRSGALFRYFLIGEYSPAGRPHYHVLFFGYWPSDSRPFGKSRAGNEQFESAELSAAWGHGHVNFQAFTPSAADYVSGYYVEKLNGDMAAEALGGRVPEFMRASRGKGGIGAPFVDRYGAQIHEGADYIVIRGAKVGVPDFFNRRLRKQGEAGVSEVQARADERGWQAAQAWAREVSFSPGATVQDRAQVKAEVLTAKRRNLRRAGVDAQP